MSEGSPFQEHWVNIEPERLERYEAMFQWNPATAHFYEPAKITKGDQVADFGCGPGHAAIEFAKWVGPQGHVHALDVNADFIRRVEENAATVGFQDRITPHLLKDANLPLANGSLDCVVARNTVIYTEDPVETFREFKRILRKGGRAHAIEGDWRLTAVEPVPTDDWRALIEAASWAWPWPEIGRRLHATAREAGFDDVEVRVLTSPDTTGRLNGMIQTVAGYARESGSLEPEKIDSILETVAEAMSDRRYLAISPQFVVTAVA
jgi:SAM-dependent methyltransferase